MVNACYDEARRVRRRAEVSLLKVGDRVVSDSSSAFAESDRVDRAFRRLPLDQRTVLVMQHHLALSHSEIAETLALKRPAGALISNVLQNSPAAKAGFNAPLGSMAAIRGSVRSARNPHTSGEASCIEAITLITVAATTGE